MKLFVKQKIFSWNDKFYVYDEFGNEKYQVEGEIFSLGKRLHIYDIDGNELALIRRKIFSFLPKYIIEINGERVAEVVKHFTLLKQSYTVNTADGVGWEIFGNFIAHSYKIYDGELPVATVEKEWLTWADTYSIDVAPYADELTALATVLIIDAALDEADNVF